MPSRYEIFDRSRLNPAALSERIHDLDLEAIKPLTMTPEVHPALRETAKAVLSARDRGAAVVLMMGAHVLRAGMQNYLADLMERGLISCLAMNGAGVIHDFEFALAGATTESVARYIKDGQFGLWTETSRINDLVSEAAAQGLGLGEGVGKAIIEGDYPHKDVSVLATAYRAGVPVTVHVGLGHDITHEHPNCDGGAYGETSYRDFLIFTRVLEGLEGGVVMNFGSAVMAPEVYLKALAMVRNVAKSEGRRIARFTTLVCDLVDLPADLTREPPRDQHHYYFRPFKTMLVRTVADGGQSHYVRAPHHQTIPQLWTALSEPSL